MRDIYYKPTDIFFLILIIVYSSNRIVVHNTKEDKEIYKYLHCGNRLERNISNHIKFFSNTNIKMAYLYNIHACGLSENICCNTLKYCNRNGSFTK